MAYEIVLGRSTADKERFGLAGSVLIGKQYVKMGASTSLSQSVFLDVNKAHVVFVCGKRGSGKCLSGDTLITLKDGRQIPVKALSSVEGRAFSLDKNLKVRSAKWEQFFKRTVNELWHVTFRSGRKLSLTPEHPLLTIRGWKPVDELGIGSRIAAPRIIDAFGSRSLPECDIKLLAYMLSEGHVKKHLFFTNSDPDIVTDFKRAVSDFQSELCVTRVGEIEYKINSKFEKRRFLGCDFAHNEKGQFSKGGCVRFEKRRIRKFFEKHELYGKLSCEKFISEGIFRLPKYQLALFLNRLFSCDGSIYYSNGWEVSYSSMSEQLVRQVQHLILRYGVLSKVRSKSVKLNGKVFTSYELVVNSENVDRFIQSIGFFGKKAVKQMQALRENALIKRNPNIDTIPKEIWDIYRPKSWVAAGEALGYCSPKAARSAIDYSPSRQKLLTIAITDQNTAIRKLAESDIFWDEIESIEPESGNFEVFDISVPKLHNFVANDIIVHNSYTLGVIAEGIAQLEPEVRDRLSVLMLDTMGIYWTMKYPNNPDNDLLKEWNLEGKGLPIVIFCPKGLFSDYKAKGIPADVPFSIRPSELGPDDWNSTFELTTNDPIAVFIERTILELKKEHDTYSISEIIQALNADKSERDETVNAAVNRFKAADSWGIFAEESTPIKELAFPGRIAVLDLSAYMTMPNGWKIKHLVMGLVCKSLFQERMLVRKSEEFESVHSALHFIKVSEDEEKLRGKEMPVVWIMVDEAHEFLPRDEKTSATDALVTLLREGRQPGIALVLATQQPGKIHTDAMTQSDVILSHRLTARIDTDALAGLMQSYLRKGLDIQLDILPKVPGACIAVDDVAERMYPLRIRPRFSWHGGSAPDILKEEVKKEKNNLFGF